MPEKIDAGALAFIALVFHVLALSLWPVLFLGVLFGAIVRLEAEWRSSASTGSPRRSASAEAWLADARVGRGGL